MAEARPPPFLWKRGGGHPPPAPPPPADDGPSARALGPRLRPPTTLLLAALVSRPPPEKKARAPPGADIGTCDPSLSNLASSLADVSEMLCLGDLVFSSSLKSARARPKTRASAPSPRYPSLARALPLPPFHAPARPLFRAAIPPSVFQTAPIMTHRVRMRRPTNPPPPPARLFFASAPRRRPPPNAAPLRAAPSPTRAPQPLRHFFFPRVLFRVFLRLSPPAFLFRPRSFLLEVSGRSLAPLSFLLSATVICFGDTPPPCPRALASPCKATDRGL